MKVYISDCLRFKVGTTTFFFVFFTTTVEPLQLKGSFYVFVSDCLTSIHGQSFLKEKHNCHNEA